MRVLLDSQLLIWSALTPDLLPEAARRLLLGPPGDVLFSSATVWEVAIKFALGRRDFPLDPQEFHGRMVAAGYVELPVTAAHAVRVRDLPCIHRDPFDRLLLAQAMAEGITLVTADATLGRYLGPVRLI